MQVYSPGRRKIFFYAEMRQNGAEFGEVHPRRWDKKVGDGSIWRIWPCKRGLRLKKGHQICGQEKCTPARENPGYAYAHMYIELSLHVHVSVCENKIMMMMMVTMMMTYSPPQFWITRRPPACSCLQKLRQTSITTRSFASSLPYVMLKRLNMFVHYLFDSVLRFLSTKHTGVMTTNMIFQSRIVHYTVHRSRVTNKCGQDNIKR